MLGSKPIPVAEAVDGMYLKRVTYERTKDFEAAKFSFLREGSWLSLYVVNPDKDPDPEVYKRKRYRAAIKLESIMSVFLDEETMRRCFQEAEDFKSFVELMIEALNLTDFKNVELDVKVLPGPKVGFSPPMVRKHGDKRRMLAYSDYELKKFQDVRKQQ